MAPGALTRAAVAAALLGATAAAAVPAVGRAEAPGDCQVVERFDRASVGEFPPGWEVRRNEGRGVYTVAQEGPLRFLRAVSRGLGIQAAKPFEWDLDAYPILAWAWRPLQFPAGADEQDGKNDSVLAVYLVVPHSRTRGPKAVKYIWSERVPAGTRLESNRGLTRVLVLRSGTEGVGRWVEERVNARDDYRASFGEGTPRPAGIAVLTDADDTRSLARGDYAHFRVCRG